MLHEYNAVSVWRENTKYITQYVIFDNVLNIFLFNAQYEINIDQMHNYVAWI